VNFPPLAPLRSSRPLQVAKKFAEVRKEREAAAGATAIAPRGTYVDEQGELWEEVGRGGGGMGWGQGPKCVRALI
jgi:hypothetical protein